MGTFSDGPGSDVIYQHYFDASFADGCRGHSCWRGDPRVRFARPSSSAASAPEAVLPPAALPAGPAAAAHARDMRFFKRFSHQVCRVDGICAAPGGAAARRKLPSSEAPDDFFFLSELRLYVLHAMGIINWVWY